MRYFAHLTTGRIILWCYFIWWAFFVLRYFESSRNLWLTSLGISLIIGIALMISTSSRWFVSWANFRLFLMPFFVSSFSALVKGHGFMLIFSPRMQENYVALAFCGAFCAFVTGVKVARR